MFIPRPIPVALEKVLASPIKRNKIYAELHFDVLVLENKDIDGIISILQEIGVEADAWVDIFDVLKSECG